MDNLVAATISQQGFYFTAFVAKDTAGIISGIGRQPVPDHLSGRILDGDQVAAVKGAAGGGDAGWQQ